MSKNLLFIIGIAAAIFLACEGVSFGSPSQTVMQDSISSPNGSWVADRLLKMKDKTTKVIISIHGKNSFAEKKDFVFQESHPGDILFSWLDNANLLIAAPMGATLPAKQDEFGGITIHYGFYPNDPDSYRISGSQKLYQKSADFSYHSYYLANFFGATNGVGIPGIGCTLHMTAQDGDYIQNLSVLISAGKSFAHKAPRMSDQTIEAPARSFSSININADKEIRKSVGYATNAKIEELSPDAGNVGRFRKFKPIMMPSGSYEPMWQIVYSPGGQEDIETVIDKIKNGTLHVKVGFWLDNAEVVYTSAKPNDLSEITKFESCIAQNAIFQKQQSDNK